MNLGEIKIKGPSRTCSTILITLLLTLALSTPLIASPLEDKKQEATDLKAQMSQVDARLGDSVSQYEEAYAKLTQINSAIQDNLAKLENTKEQLESNRQIIDQRLNSIYRNREIGVMSVILGAQDFENFLSRLRYLKNIFEEDITTLKEIESLKKEQEERDAKLAENKAKQRVIINKVEAEKAELEKALKQKQELMASVTTEIKSIEEEERRRQEEEKKKALADLAAINNNTNGGTSDSTNTASSGATSFAPDSSFTFPVTQPYTYCDSWHAPRVGHLHQGTDIFALRGTAARACVNGWILRLSNGELGGIGITLRDQSGNTYYYGHFDGRPPGLYEGMPVSAGQTIGYVGDTGNAKGTPPHVHFEIHPGGGSAVNPYPILKIVG